MTKWSDEHSHWSESGPMSIPTGPPGLAIDAATVTGIAHSDGLLATWDFHSSDPHPGYVAASMLGRLARLHETHPFEWVALEHSAMGALAGPDPRTGKPRISHQVIEFHGRLRGAVEIFAFRHKMPVRLFNPATIKKFITGSGRAKKPQVIRAVELYLKKAPRNDNEADAAALLSLAEYDLNRQTLEQAAKGQQRQLRLP